MNIFQEWISQQVNDNVFPLFECNSQNEVSTHIRINKRSGVEYQVLSRSNEFERHIIDSVQRGLKDNRWQGIVYIMHWRSGGTIIPLYIGKAEKIGRSQKISQNLVNLDKNKYHFARWGDGLDYHIGDLSHSIFREKAYRKPTKKYERWAEKLFLSKIPPVLKNPTFIMIVNWYEGMKGPSTFEETVPSLEKQLVGLASEYHPDDLLNIDGR